MFAVPLVLSGLSLLGINELYNYLNYKKIVDISQPKKKQDVECIDSKSSWYINYISSMSQDNLKEWVINNIRPKDKTNMITLEHVDKHRISKFLSFNIYNKSFKLLDNSEKHKIDIIVMEIENKLGVTFIDRCDHEYEYYKFGHNQIVCTYKPTIFYSALYLIKKYTYGILIKAGFECHKVNSVKYFYKKVNENNNYTMFIHGLGFGSTPYLNFILSLSKKTNIIVPILPNISNMEFDDKHMFPDYSAIVSTFTEIINNVGITEDNSLNIIGHSFGTIITAILLSDNNFYKYVNKKVLVDPVCFINKYYKVFKYLDDPYDGGKTINKMFNACVYDDIYVRYATQRFLCGLKFWITDMSILQNSLVILSGQDKIVPSHDILQTLQENEIPSIISEDAIHGQIFTSEYIDIQSVMIDFVSHT